jgi:hypothetical protein
MKKRVIIYVEGSSDKMALQALLLPIIEQASQRGITISFFETPSGDRKYSVLTKVPQKAANILLNDTDSIVVAMPDLYPKNKGFQHETCEELFLGINKRFEKALRDKAQKSDFSIQNRFKVFCLKHDLEALILASEDSLKNQLGIHTFRITWHTPVEDQDHDQPPKKIVEDLYKAHGKRYRDTIDAPLILGASNYQDIAGKCPQCFKPFIEFLLSVVEGK